MRTYFYDCIIRFRRLMEKPARHGEHTNSYHTYRERYLKHSPEHKSKWEIGKLNKCIKTIGDQYVAHNDRRFNPEELQEPLALLYDEYTNKVLKSINTLNEMQGLKIVFSYEPGNLRLHKSIAMPILRIIDAVLTENQKGDNMKRFDERQIGFIEAIEKHIQKVGTQIRFVCDELMNRAVIHDESKLSDAEIHRGYEAHWDKIDKKIAWGTPEYDEHCKEFKDIIDLHREGNRHHPEFHPNGVRDMDLIDIMEMFCDWWASGDNLDKSIEYNAEKYGFENSILHDILRNTARRYDVYMTSQGDVYHRGDCHELEGSKIIQISLDEAKRLEYEFCDSCKRRKSTLS